MTRRVIKEGFVTRVDKEIKTGMTVMGQIQEQSRMFLIVLSEDVPEGGN